MDEKPFFEFNMEKYRESQVEKLREFHKSYFDVETILNTASELKYTNEIRNAIVKEVNDPTTSSSNISRVRFIRAVSTTSHWTIPGYRETGFCPICEDYMNERLKSAIGADTVVEARAELKSESAALQPPFPKSRRANVKIKSSRPKKNYRDSTSFDRPVRGNRRYFPRGTP